MNQLSQPARVVMLGAMLNGTKSIPALYPRLRQTQIETELIRAGMAYGRLLTPEGCKQAEQLVNLYRMQERA